MSYEKLQTLCKESLVAKGIDDDVHRRRLDSELYEIQAQAEEDYFLKLHESQTRFAENENNLLVAYLLDLAPSVDINADFAFIQGEFPDIDIDYNPEVRDYLKNEWAAEHFGVDNICSIGTYGTMGIKSAMLDMTKVYGYSKDEIQAITVRMEDKDDEGKLLEWDKALELYPDFKKYCETFPEVADSAKMLIDRNRSGGVHAGGLIIADCKLSDFVPLEVRSVNKDNPKGVIVSAWTEGQATQDLQPVGLIKFDMLVVAGLKQYSLAAKLVKERHGLTAICAHEGGKDWSDISYLNDPKAIALANKADLKGIFQFDSEGIRKVVQKGGVSNFDDIAAYSALYRPGPLNEGMDETFCNRKKGEEKYSLHPLIRPILGLTYGVMIYQEQVMQMLNIVGGIPLIHCEKIRKLISKKKEEEFAKYKEQFVTEGQLRLGVDKEFVENLWAQIEAFAAYGFNRSHSYAYSYISARQLWLKAHYPLEFYTALLMCEKDQSKIKEYKQDAARHGVEVAGVHINNSKMNFVIGTDNKIYFGFGNIKGIGTDIAEKIVAGQPYASFGDFLTRFGTESKVLKPLIALGVFEEDYDRIALFKFYEYFKDSSKKRKDRTKRNEEALVKYQNQLDELLMEYTDNPNDVPSMNRFEDECYDLWKKHFGSKEVAEEFKYKGELRTRTITVLKKLEDVRRKRDSSIRLYKEKESDAEEPISMTMKGFSPSLIKLDKDTEKLLANTKSAFREAQSEFYGFQWVHELEESPDYTGLTLEKFDQSGQAAGPIEVKIVKKENRTSKSGNQYSSLKIEYATSRQGSITIWEDDYERFADEFVTGNLIRIQVKPPCPPFPSYSMDGPKKHERARVLPKDKAYDYRVYLMRKAPEEIETNKKHLVDPAPTNVQEFDILV